MSEMSIKENEEHKSKCESFPDPLSTPFLNLENSLLAPLPTQSPDSFTFYAIGDWGLPTPEVLQVAENMERWSSLRPENLPVFIISLGDNFYPNGVHSVTDPLFKESWMDVFLCHQSLNVPWMVTIGNHDYRGNPEAQIDFTFHPLNPNGLWRCPSHNYSFSQQIPNPDGPHPASVDFFCLDTNGVQTSRRSRYPNLTEELKAAISELSAKLDASTARWKIVYAHHPIYTKGRLHGITGRCLGKQKFIDENGIELDGFGLEDVLVRGGVTAYITGHEHKLQYHQCRGVNYFVAGASGYENNFYGGSDMSNTIDWIDNSKSSGFLSVKVNYEMITFSFVTSKGVLKEVQIR